MQFKILGPLEVYSDGQEIRIHPSSVRQTLVALLLLLPSPPEPPLPPSHERLAAALWGDDQAASRAEALRNRIYALRNALGRERMPTKEPGGRQVPARYWLRVEPGELDASNFRTLAASGDAAMGGGDLEGAARLLREAIKLWRDPPWGDRPATPVLDEVARELDEARTEVRLQLNEALLGLGRYREVLGPAREIIRADPCRELAHEQFMRALYQAGRPRDALNAFRDARRMIDKELGAEPGKELQALHQQILVGDPALTAPRAHARAAPAPAHGHGHGHGQLSWPPASQLPAAPADFTGRLALLGELARHLPARGQVAVTVITGPAGAGKTTLALRAGHVTHESFPDGQLYAHLGGPTAPRAPQEVLGQMLRSLGVAPEPVPPAERETLYRSLLAERRVLVVADDAAYAAQVRPLIPGTGGSAVLVTSRSRLPDLEAANLVELGDMPHDEAVTLLAKIAAPAGLTAADEAAGQIADGCAGLPLALRAAGARLANEPGLTPPALAAALAGPDPLAELAVGDLSVTARLEDAYEVLDDLDRRAFRFLSLFPGKQIPGWLIPVLLGEAGTEPAGARITQAGLLTMVRFPGLRSSRFRMHPLTACYAARRRAEADGQQAAAQASERMTGAWLQLADHTDRLLPRHPYLPVPAAIGPASAGWAPPPPDDALSWFALEHDNLVALARQACANPAGLAAASGLADRLFSAQCQLGRGLTAQRMWETIAAAARAAGDVLAAARARYRLAVLSVIRGDGVRQTARTLVWCLPAFTAARDHASAADALHLLARCAIDDPDPVEARRAARDGLEEARRVGDRRLIFLNMAELGIAETALGDTGQGLDHCRQAAGIAASTGERAYEQEAREAVRRAQRFIDQPLPSTWALRSQAADDA